MYTDVYNFVFLLSSVLNKGIKRNQEYKLKSSKKNSNKRMYPLKKKDIDLHLYTFKYI